MKDQGHLHLSRFIHYQLKLLSACVWGSALLFGLYILGFYALALISQDFERWNSLLPGLFTQNRKMATYGIGLHFLGGGIILILGSLQFVDWIRIKWLKAHRLMGQIYVLACLLAGVGGLVFIAINRTIGGWPMDLAFAIYGLLISTSAIQTARHGMSGNLLVHRHWAIRLYALAIGSWFYRMGYGFWYLVVGKVGHTSTFSGPFDYFMDFFFFIPNLMVAEVIIRGFRLKGFWQELVGATTMIAVTTYVVLATYFFTSKYWLEGIIILKDFILN